MLLITLAIAVLIIGISANYILKNKKPDIEDRTSLTEVQMQSLLAEHIPYYGKLKPPMQQRFVQKANEFITSVRIEGVGFEVTDADKIMVAASAVIPILNFEGWTYMHLTNVIVYPDTFNNDFQYEGGKRDMVGLVGSGFMNGQMLLSRAALIKGFSKTAGEENAAIHEFVHLLDDTDGAIDGIPENLIEHANIVPWLKMMHQEMHRIQEGKSDINPYALTNEAEFLAVASEYFFEKPDEFSKKHPELYQAMSAMFNQNPVAD